jgi:hypothetical protein
VINTRYPYIEPSQGKPRVVLRINRQGRFCQEIYRAIFNISRYQEAIDATGFQ